MIPYILAAVGGYLIGDSLKGKQYAEGGMMGKGGEIKVGDKVKYKNAKYHATVTEVIEYAAKFPSSYFDREELPYAIIEYSDGKVQKAYLEDLQKVTLGIAPEYVNTDYIEKMRREWKEKHKMADGGMMANGGRIKVGTFSEEQLKNKEDKKAVEKAQKESGLTYVDTKIIKKGGKMYLDVYLIPNEEYYNSSKYADGGMMGGMIKKWELKPNGRYYATFLIDKKDPKYREIVEHGITESVEEVDGCYEIIISVTEKGKEYFENNFVNSGYMASGGTKKGDIGKSGTQYVFTLKEYEEMGDKIGLFVSPKQWWKSREGKQYKDSSAKYIVEPCS